MKQKPASNSVRIIGGSLKGSNLSFPAEEGLRPTGARIRETLFNWLQPYISGARCLDLFAGSGALAFESASRDASTIIAVETSRPVFESLQENARRLGTPTLELCRADALQWLENYKGPAFDIIFLDPPYNRDILQTLLDLLAGSPAAKPGTLVYTEHDRNSPAPQLAPEWEAMKQKKAGNVVYYLLHRQ